MNDRMDSLIERHGRDGGGGPLRESFYPSILDDFVGVFWEESANGEVVAIPEVSIGDMAQVLKTIFQHHRNTKLTQDRGPLPRDFNFVLWEHGDDEGDRIVFNPAVAEIRFPVTGNYYSETHIWRFDQKKRAWFFVGDRSLSRFSRV